MPVAVGSPAPDFALKDQNNQEVRLAQFRGRKPVLLVFYPATFTGICQGELTAIQENTAAFDGVQVLAVSVDSVYAHKVWALDRGFDFPLLADFWPHGAVAQAYDVFDPVSGVAGRGTFLIDKDGVVRFAELSGPGEARNQTGWHEAIAALK